MKILINHIGYEQHAPKKALLACQGKTGAGGFALVPADGGAAVFHGAAVECGEVARWHTGYYYLFDFTAYCGEGIYILRCDTPEGPVLSQPFEIRHNLLGHRTLSDAGYYFKAQRSSGEWLEADRHITFMGSRAGVLDVHGGWYDASGDPGIHMSHLSHSTYFNPQQHPLSAYVFFKAFDLLEATGNGLYNQILRRYLDEGYVGADFIMRMRTEKGTFFRAVQRLDSFASVRVSRNLVFEYDHSSRQFGAAMTAGQETIADRNYETSLRCGGGLCITALAAAGRHYYPSAGYSQSEYILAAKDSYACLEANNETYANDGQWNLVDEYCALAALTELYLATRENTYRLKGREMARRILKRFVQAGEGGYFSVDGTGRPFFHASDAGLPVMALLGFLDIARDEALSADILRVCGQAMAYQLAVTKEVNNPFGYARQLVRTGGRNKTAFFFPHDTEAAPWWQGENARLASLAAAAYRMAAVTADAEKREALLRFAADQLDWILGLNPFDSCMMKGHGRNHIEYYSLDRYEFMACPGGIVNGITGGIDDDEGICYHREPDEAVKDNWRWAEQWIPHVSWYIWAVALAAV